MSTWIFLRGLTRESRHWGDFVSLFQNAMPSHTVLLLDLPGNGVLNQQRSPSQVQDMVAYCRTTLASRQLAPPYSVLAMSLGAMVAVAWADAHPQEVEAQVLINTSLRPFSPFYQRLQPQNYAKLLRLALLGATPETWENAILDMTSNVRNEMVLPLWQALRIERPVSHLNALRQLLAAARYRAPQRKPVPPTLILASEQDQLVSVECSKILATQWQSALRLHPGAGHDLPLDDGPWVAAQVRQWQLEQQR